MDGNQTLSRENLYEQVWAVPMVQLAKEYGLSDRGLAKICKKLEVPVPGRGYWAKKENGKKVKKLGLPRLTSKGRDSITIQKNQDSAPNIPKENDFISELKNEPVKVAAKLTNPHPLVVQTKDALSNYDKRFLHRGLIGSGRNESLDLTVSPEQLSRSLRIFDGLIKHLESKDCAVKIKSDSYQKTRTVIVLKGYEIEIGMTEKVLQRKIENKKTESYSWNEYQYLPTGKLVLKIKNIPYSGLRQNWTDGKSKTIETQLPSFMAALFLTADYLDQKEAERMEQEKIWQEKKRQEEIAAQKIKDEQNRIDQLEDWALSWSKAENIRLFLSSTKERLIQSNPEKFNSPDFQSWFKWALAYADQIDPLGNKTTQEDQ